MKKLLFMLVVTMISIATISAQESKKTERKAKKEQRIQQNMKEVFDAFSANDLTFVPTEMSTNTSARIQINDYYYLKLEPKYISIDLPYLTFNGSLQVATTIFEVVKKEQTNDGYLMTLKVLANNTYYNITLNTNSKNNLTNVTIETTGSSGITYTGTVRPN